jgi:hypothetical protein
MSLIYQPGAEIKFTGTSGGALKHRARQGEFFARINGGDRLRSLPTPTARQIPANTLANTPVMASHFGDPYV